VCEYAQIKWWGASNSLRWAIGLEANRNSNSRSRGWIIAATRQQRRLLAWVRVEVWEGVYGGGKNGEKDAWRPWAVALEPEPLPWLTPRCGFVRVSSLRCRVVRYAGRLIWFGAARLGSLCLAARGGDDGTLLPRHRWTTKPKLYV
jgi:hypothetical protein